jgi:hypothetical protein
MNGGVGAWDQKRGQRKQNQTCNSERPVALAGGLVVEPDAMREQSHTVSRGWVCTKVTVPQKDCCELRHECKPLNKRRLRKTVDRAQKSVAANVRLAWAFCHSTVVKCPTRDRLQNDARGQRDSDDLLLL